MSVTNPDSEYEALTYVVDRIAGRFPRVSEDTVLDLVADELIRFEGVPVRAFVPVLVEGSVVRLLRDQAA